MLSALEAISKTLDGIEVTAAAGKAIKEKAEEGKKENIGNELNQEAKAPDAVSYDSKELKPPPVMKVVHAPPKGVQRRTDGAVWIYATSETSTKEGGPGRPDTIIIIKYKIPADKKPAEKTH